MENQVPPLLLVLCMAPQIAVRQLIPRVSVILLIDLS